MRLKLLLLWGLIGLLGGWSGAVAQTLDAPDRVMYRDSWDEYVFEALRFSPQGDRLAVVTDNGTLFLIDAKTQRTLWQQSLGANTRGRGVLFAPDGKTIYTSEVSLLARIQAFSTQSGKRRWIYRAAQDLKGTVGQGTFAGINRDLAMDPAGNLYAMSYWTVFGSTPPVALTQVVSLDPQGRTRWLYPRHPLAQTVSGGLSLRGSKVALVTGDFVTDFTRPNQGLTTTILSTQGKFIAQQRLAPQGSTPISTVTAPVFEPKGQIVLTLGGNGQAVLYQAQGKEPKLIPKWQKTFIQPKDQVTVYAKFVQNLAPNRWLLGFGTTAPLAGAKEEDPKVEHPQSNTLLLIDDQGKSIQRWRVASLDRVPLWDGKTIAVPISQNTITPTTTKGLLLIDPASGKTRQVLTTQGAVIAVAKNKTSWAVIEVPLKVGDQTFGNHKIHWVPIGSKGTF